MSHLLGLARAARLIGVSRAALQQRIKDGNLHAFDGMITTEELLKAYPDLTLEDSGVFERTLKIKEEAFGRRVRERSLPPKEVLAERVFEQSRELGDVKLHLQRYHALVTGLQSEVRDLMERSGPSAREALRHLDGWVEGELRRVLGETEEPDSLALMDDMLRVMSAHVTLRPSQHDFLVEGADSILEAGLKAGLALNYGCSTGNCGLCKARVISGQVMKIRHFDYVFTEAERQQGYTLMCCHSPVDDVTLETLEAGSAQDIPTQQITARVKAVQALDADMRLLHLQTPRSSRLRFLAGQSLTLGLAGAGTAEFVIASCPCDDRNLQFHVERGQGGAFGRMVFDGLRVGDSVSLYGPWGDYLLDDESQRALLFIAFGRGFGPVKSMVEHALAREASERIDLAWAAAPGGHYMVNQCRYWADALDNFRYRSYELLAPDRPAMDRFAARIAEDYPDFANHAVYLAGPSDYLTVARESLAEAGLPPQRMHAIAC